MTHRFDLILQRLLSIARSVAKSTKKSTVFVLLLKYAKAHYSNIFTFYANGDLEDTQERKSRRFLLPHVYLLTETNKVSGHEDLHFLVQ